MLRIKYENFEKKKLSNYLKQYIKGIVHFVFVSAEVSILIFLG